MKDRIILTLSLAALSACSGGMAHMSPSCQNNPTIIGCTIGTAMHQVNQGQRAVLGGIINGGEPWETQNEKRSRMTRNHIYSQQVARANRAKEIAATRKAKKNAR